MQTSPHTRLVVLASGEGSTFTALVEASRDGRLPAEIVGLITDREAPALARAARAGVPGVCVSPRAFADRAAWDRATLEVARGWRADWLVLAGYLALVGPEVLRGYPSRIVNSHPALLPDFGGAGMYGDRVHRAVVAAGARESGVTVHLIDEVFDRGEIVAQAHVPVLDGDTAETLAERVKAREREFYPEVLARLIRAPI